MTVHELGKRFKDTFGFYPPLDKISIMLDPKKVKIDVIQLDEILSDHDPEYNGAECSYKNNQCSMIEYIELKYGKEAKEFVLNN